MTGQDIHVVPVHNSLVSGPPANMYTKIYSMYIGTKQLVSVTAVGMNVTILTVNLQSIKGLLLNPAEACWKGLAWG